MYEFLLDLVTGYAFRMSAFKSTGTLMASLAIGHNCFETKAMCGILSSDRLCQAI